MVRAEKLQISLAAARVNAKMTQDEAARRMGVGKQTIGNWEKGKITPKPAQMHYLAEIYNIPLDCIFLPSNIT